MKKITLSILYLLLLCGLKAQSCQDIFVSEVFFCKDSLVTTDSAYVENYALELYNPTDADIDLTDYCIKLTPQVGNPMYIYLIDTIRAKSTFVITKIGAATPLLSIARMVSNTLDFDNFVMVELYKQDNSIDRIGAINLTNPDDIDIMEAIANPSNYLNGVNIDLTSLERCIFRRNPMIGRGNINFDNLSLEWYVQPNNDFTDADRHTNICKGTDVIVEFAQDFYEINEGQSIIPAINVYNYDSTCARVLIDVGKKSTPPYNISYPFYVDNNDIITPTHASLEVPNIRFPIIAEEKESGFEPDEVVIYELEKTLINGRINPAKRFVTVLIHNAPYTNYDAPIVDKPYSETPLLIYPNPSANRLFIRQRDNQKIAELRLVDMLGRELYTTTKSFYSIDMEEYTDGQYILLIKMTDSNIIYSYKIIKN